MQCEILLDQDCVFRMKIIQEIRAWQDFLKFSIYLWFDNVSVIVSVLEHAHLASIDLILWKEGAPPEGVNLCPADHKPVRTQ